MSLSNTAVPIYYGQFREAVLRGDIRVCETVSMEMNRIDRLIADPRYYYDDKAVEGYVAFCNNELTLTDGSNMNLLDTFKLWAEQIFGWYYFLEKSIYEPTSDNHGGHFVRKTVKKRLINKQYLIIGRGASKTVYDASIHAYFLTVDRTRTDQVATAPTMRQAEETLTPIQTAINRSRGPLFKFLTYGSLQNTTGSKANRQKLASTKKGIQNFFTESIVRILPMRIDKLQGLRCKVATIDEWLSGDIREDPVGAIEQGASKVDDYLILSTSSEGTVRNGVGDTMKIELMDILKGDYDDPHTSIWYYRLDDIKEVGDPSMWEKAQPNIGKTVSYETYQRDVERAEHSPSARNDILAKRFGLPLEGYTYFFTYEETKVHKKKEYWGMPCALGCDLSRGDDFCAFTFLFPLKGLGFGIKVLSFITSRTFANLPPARKYQYQTFIDEGSLMVLEGHTLEIPQVYDWLDRHIANCRYTVMCLGYDPYNAKEFLELWTRDNGEYGIEKVIQGKKTETVPLGELKDFAEDGLLLFDEGLMSFGMGNAVVEQDINGNRMLVKMRHDEKIDNVSALMDAYVAFKLHRDEFG